MSSYIRANTVYIYVTETYLACDKWQPWVDSTWPALGQVSKPVNTFCHHLQESFSHCLRGVWLILPAKLLLKILRPSCVTCLFEVCPPVFRSGDGENFGKTLNLHILKQFTGGDRIIRLLVKPYHFYFHLLYRWYAVCEEFNLMRFPRLVPWATWLHACLIHILAGWRGLSIKLSCIFSCKHTLTHCGLN